MSNTSLQVHIAKTAKVAKTVQFEGTGTIIVGEFSVIEDHVLLSTGDATGKIEIGLRSKIKWGTVLRCYDGAIRVGGRTSIGEYNVLTGHGGLTIGNAVIIAGHCYFTSAEHIADSHIGIRFQGETAKGIYIDDGAWIGAHCAILDGVYIGVGTIVGAGSVVTRSLPPNYICVGTPCRPIRFRESA